MIRKSHKNKIGIIVQCRTKSSRLKNKLLLKINGYCVIEILLMRLKKIKNADIICAIAKEKNNQNLKKIIKKNDVNFFEGSELNVLKRYYDASKQNKFRTIIRITSDCPLIDPLLIENGIKLFNKKKVDYLSNNLKQTWPQGLDFEIFSFKTLEKCFNSVKKNSEKEHVTEFIRSNSKFKKFNYKNSIKLKKYFRWTIDTKLDYQFFFFFFKKKPNLINDFSWINLYKYLNKNYKIQSINASSHHFYFKN